VRNFKTLKKSISPLVISNGINGCGGGDNLSNVSSSDGSVIFQRNTSPDSLVLFKIIFLKIKKILNVMFPSL
jgi:hypothetical protein